MNVDEYVYDGARNNSRPQTERHYSKKIYASDDIDKAKEEIEEYVRKKKEFKTQVRK